jgi:hypothetical protein
MIKALGQWLAKCGLELHPERTKIVYFKDGQRRRDYSSVKFDVLGTVSIPASQEPPGKSVSELQSGCQRESGQVHSLHHP